MVHHEQSLNLYFCLLYNLIFKCFLAIFVFVVFIQSFYRFGRYLTCHQNGLCALQVGKLLINNLAKIHQNHDMANCVGQQYIDVLHTQLDLSQKESAVVKFDFSPLRSITNMRESNIISNSRCTSIPRYFDSKYELFRT